MGYYDHFSPPTPDPFESDPEVWTHLFSPEIAKKRQVPKLLDFDNHFDFNGDLTGQASHTDC
jgi:hypothetical protein